MDLDPSMTSTLVVVALVLSVLALVTALVAHLRLSGTQARYRILWADGEKDVIAVVSHQASKIARLQSDIEGLRAQLSRSGAKGGVDRVGEVTLTPGKQQALVSARTGKGST